MNVFYKYEWLKMYNWLAYSAIEDGAYCLPCVLFGREVGVNAAKLDRLMNNPIKIWTSALTKFKKHETLSEVHKAAVVMAQDFRKSMESKSVPVQHQLDTAAGLRVLENRKKLASILKTIILCGRQNLPLRGHRDDSQHLSSTVNTGNFQKLLEFRIDAGDKVLYEHFESAPRNATYRSKTVQNELIACCGDFIKSEIVNNIKASGYFSIMADEATDSSNIEQLPLVIRYLHKETLEVKEDFVGFVECKGGVSGEAVANEIMDAVDGLGLDMTLCRGQSYDGAGNMAGKIKGAAAKIKNIYPQAIYIHCTSHQLNLCVMKACTIQMVRNMMATVTELANFFNFSPKRQSVLEKKIEELCPESKVFKLKDLCRTRWVERLDALDTIQALIEPVVQTLDEIRNDKMFHPDTTTKANGLFHAISHSDFIMAMIICKELLSYTRGLTTKLQGKNMELPQAYTDVQTVKETLQEVRKNIENYHRVWFATVQELAQLLDVEIKKPRSCVRQQNRNNVESESAEVYYRRAFTIPFLDHIIEELSTRFTDGQTLVPLAQSIIPEYMKHCKQWQQDFIQLTAQYSSDLPNPQSLHAELDIWERTWNKTSNLPGTVAATIKATDQLLFPNIYEILKIICTWPVTTCECERSVSGLRRLKTYMRTTIGQERLNGLALLHVHYSIDIDIDQVVDIFNRKHPRRLVLVDILNSD